MRFTVFGLATALLLSACSQDSALNNRTSSDSLYAMQSRLDSIVSELLVEQKAAGVGLAVIRQGDIVLESYYGEQSPDIPVSASTLFNVASVAKTVTAETLIALAAKDLIDLDEPIAKYVNHPDLAKDPRYQQLTPRLLLSHRAGLLNWAYVYDDGILAFDHDPDTQFSYSGAGIELAARYAEVITGKELQTLAFTHVLEPIGITEVSMGVIPDWAHGRLTMPMDGDGNFQSIAALNASLASGDANGAADDLLVTVPAYAALIIALLESNWLTEEQVKEREHIVTSLADDPVFRCPDLQWVSCPTAHGFSLGWQVYEYGEHKVIKHSGSDAGENAIVYYSPDAGHGAVIFVNGANGWVLMTRIMEIIGDEPLIADYYRGLVDTVMGQPMPPLEP